MPDAKDIDIGFAVGLPPAEAIAYFESKGYTISWNWFEVWQQAQAKAFTVAKVLKLDTLQTIRDEIQNALDNGITQREFVKNLEPLLKKLGWWGLQEIDGDMVQLGSPWRLRNIYRVNLQTAYNAGRYRAMTGTTNRRPYWQYIAVLDNNTRDTHRALNGKVFRFDDPIWNTIYPPNGWGCRCRVRALSQRRLEANGLQVESSDGKLKDFEVRAGFDKKAGEIIYADVTGFEYAPNKFFKPDAGWSYNPGATDFDVPPNRWDSDLSDISNSQSL